MPCSCMSIVQGLITTLQRKFFNTTYLMLGFGMVAFSLCLAVRPENRPTLIAHTVPFMILQIALAFSQVTCSLPKLGKNGPDFS